MNDSKVGTLFNLATSSLKNPAAWLLQALGIDNKSNAGISVTANSVLGIPEVTMAVQKISGHLAQMGIECRERVYPGSSASRPYWNDPGARALRCGSECFNRFTLIEKLVIDALIFGNGRWYIERNKMGQPIGLLPIQAENATTVVSEGERWHWVTIDSESTLNTLDSETQTAGQYKIHDRDVFYLMGLTRNGWWGENPIQILKDTFGLAIAGQEAAGSSFRNAGRPGLMLEAPRGTFKTEKERQEFVASFNESHEGLDKAGKTGLIHNGMKAHVLPNDTVNTGYVQQRQFQREGIAMAFLLESVFGDNTGSTYKSVSERNAAYMTNCLGRWAGKIEAEADAKLLSQRQRDGGLFCYQMNKSVIYKHDRLGLATYTSTLRQQQCISGNEVRDMHDLPPAEGLDDDFNAVGGTPKPEETEGDESETEEVTEETTPEEGSEEDDN